MFRAALTKPRQVLLFGRGLASIFTTPRRLVDRGDLPPVPEYQPRHGETTELKRARLVYQSRKRGMLENGILLSCFAAKYLDTMTNTQLDEFDNLINKPSNDWDIFHWISGKTPPPPEYQGEVMRMLQEFVQNKEKEARLTQPDLYPTETHKETDLNNTNK